MSNEICENSDSFTVKAHRAGCGVALLFAMFLLFSIVWIALVFGTIFYEDGELELKNYIALGIGWLLPMFFIYLLRNMITKIAFSEQITIYKRMAGSVLLDYQDIDISVETQGNLIFLNLTTKNEQKDFRLSISEEDAKKVVSLRNLNSKTN